MNLINLINYLMGYLGFLYFNVVDISQRISLREVDKVLLPSPHAEDLFKENFSRFKGDYYKVNLLVPDNPYKSTRRKFFTFAGGINKGKGFQDFINLINYAHKKNLKYKFLIITSCNIKNYLKNLLLILCLYFFHIQYQPIIRAGAKLFHDF